VLNVARNAITGLSELAANERLSDLDLRDNALANAEEFEHLKGLRLLRTVQANGCPLQVTAPEVKIYREAVLCRLQQLTMLEETEVSAEEKVTNPMWLFLGSTLTVRIGGRSMRSSTTDCLRIMCQPKRISNNMARCSLVRAMRMRNRLFRSRWSGWMWPWEALSISLLRLVVAFLHQLERRQSEA
jgi:hypothetical protein